MHLVRTMKYAPLPPPTTNPNTTISAPNSCSQTCAHTQSVRDVTGNQAERAKERQREAEQGQVRAKAPTLISFRVEVRRETKSKQATTVPISQSREIRLPKGQ